MKPSEVFNRAAGLALERMAIRKKAEDLRNEADLLDEKAEAVTFAMDDVRVLLDHGATWEKIEERLSDLDAGIIPDPPAEQPKTERKPRADKGKSRGPSRAQGTDPAQEQNLRDIRAIKEALTHGPLTASELMTAAKVDQTTIARHLAANAVIASWTGERAGDSACVTLIGTIAQRDAWGSPS